MLTADDIRDFNGYLKACTNVQVLGVIAKERGAGHDEYAALAEAEAEARGLRIVVLGLDFPEPDDDEHASPRDLFPSDCPDRD